MLSHSRKLSASLFDLVSGKLVASWRTFAKIGLKIYFYGAQCKSNCLLKLTTGHLRKSISSNQSQVHVLLIFSILRPIRLYIQAGIFESSFIYINSPLAMKITLIWPWMALVIAPLVSQQQK